MAQINITETQQLEAFLELLVTRGVEEFEGFGFHVRFSESCFTEELREEPEPAPESRRVEAPKPQSPWEDPALWPNGHRPTFPTNERK